MAWLTGWSYRKEISITGQAGAGTNYQVKLDIGDSAGGDFHLEGNCTNFPQDIEVTDNDGTTLLKFYIKDIAADPLRMWIKIADDLGSNQTIYVYYGKSGATTNSSISDTFISGFDGDSTGWTEVDPNSHISFANNRLEWAGLHRGEDAYVYQSASVNSDVFIEYTFKQTAADVAGVATFGVISDMVDDWYHVDNGLRSFGNYYDGSTYHAQVQKRVSDVRGVGTPNITYLLNTQYWVRTVVDRSGNLATSVYSDATRSTQVGSTSTISLSDLSATLQYAMILSAENTGGGFAARACSGWLDDFWIRKYNSPEPAFSSAGSEEAYPGHTFNTKNRVFQDVNPATIEITPTSGATLLVVGIVTYLNITRTGGAPTFNGDTLTQVGSVETASESNVEMWYLADPSIGTYDVSIPNTNGKSMFIVASVYKAQAGHTSTLDVTNQNNAVSANPSVAVTTTENGDVIVDVMGDGYTSKPSANSDTLLYSTDNGGMSDNHQYALQTTAGAITLSWTVASDDWCMIVGAFKEVVSAVLGHPWFYERKQ